MTTPPHPVVGVSLMRHSRNRRRSAKPYNNAAITSINVRGYAIPSAVVHVPPRNSNAAPTPATTHGTTHVGRRNSLNTTSSWHAHGGFADDGRAAFGLVTGSCCDG